MAAQHSSEEYLDVLTSSGLHTGIAKPRSQVHRDGDYHRAVHVWIYAENTGELLLQKRADEKDSWPGLWDISSAGHISSGDTSLTSARRELQEELGVTLPFEAFELLFVYLQECVINDGTFINNEYNDVYLVTTLEPIPLNSFALQKEEVSMVKYIGWKEYKDLLRTHDAAYVPYEVDGAYGKLFSSIQQRYESNYKERQVSIQEKLNRYVPVELTAKLTMLSQGDLRALLYTVHAANILEKIFLEQVWPSNPALKHFLEEHQNDSDLSKLKFLYFLINKSPWSCLDENEAFLTTADSVLREAPGAVKAGPGWKGLQYKAAFPVQKPPGANFYPADMDRAEFELWLQNLDKEDQATAMGFFTVIRRHDQVYRDDNVSGHNLTHKHTVADHLSKMNALNIVPYSKEYNSCLTKAAELLRTAGSFADTPSLKILLEAKADAFMSDEYYDSDIAWMELDSPIDVTIGPYETYEDCIFGYKATFEAFIGIRDEMATAQVKLFSHHLQELEDNLPLDTKYKSKGVKASPIRVMQLIYNAGDVKGPQTVAFNLPNDERIVKERGTAMVMMKNVSEAKFHSILQPIAQMCLSELQQKDVDFESFFTHTICHECCHGIGPHSIILPNGKETTVRLELQELHSSIEEAKADIVGLWALHYLVDQNLLPKQLGKTMYVSFLSSCFRSIRFGLKEAHGKGQALQFNWILEKGGFVMHPDGSFAVDFSKVRDAVECLSKEILTIQAQGDKDAARRILENYATITPPLKRALDRLQSAAVPVDIYPSFDVMTQVETTIGPVPPGQL